MLRERLIGNGRFCKKGILLGEEIDLNSCDYLRILLSFNA